MATKPTAAANEPAVPTIGRILVALGVPHDHNSGRDLAPAIVCRAEHDEDLVNVRVLCDGPAVLWWTSVPVFATAEEANAAREEFLAGSEPGAEYAAVYWPTRA